MNIATQKKALNQDELVSLTEKLLQNRIDMKYYRAVISLLEKGYLLNDISAALMAAVENGAAAVPKEKKEQRRTSKPAKQIKLPAKKEPEKVVKKQEKSIKKNEKKKVGNAQNKNVQTGKRKIFKPNPRKVKNENRNS